MDTELKLLNNFITPLKLTANVSVQCVQTLVHNVCYYVFHDRVTLFFADNFSTECRITIEILHNFF